MAAQDVLFIVGIVALVAAAVMVGLAIWTYRALDIRGVRADLSGVARASAAAAAPTAARRSSARAFSEATWGGVVSKSGEAQKVAPTEHVPRPVEPPPRRPAHRSAPPPAADEPTSVIEAPEQGTGAFAFRIVRREMGAESPRGIEE